jgi:peroxiredoxin
VTRILPIILMAATAISPAMAQSTWTAAQCGAEPKVPTVSTANVSQYNASVDAVQAYDHAARIYNACVNQHAQQEETAISEDARTKIARIQSGSTAVQKRIGANFAALAQQLSAGAHKLGGH